MLNLEPTVFGAVVVSVMVVLGFVMDTALDLLLGRFGLSVRNKDRS